MTNRRTLAAGLLLATLAVAPRAPAQTPEELKHARELFQEAYKDEQESRFQEALEKFRRVAKVRESAAVRYRIATVLASMGRLHESRDAFRALAASKASLPANEREIADSSAEKALELDRRIPRLAVTLPSPAPADLRVSVDGTPVPVTTTPRPIELDPGDHAVQATATGKKPYDATVHLADGAGEVSHAIELVDQPKAPPVVVAPPPPPESHTAAWIALGAGAALFIGGGVMLVLREGAIDDINTTCPEGRCPASKRKDVESAHDRASLYGPLGVTLGALGLIGVGVGVYLLVKPSSSAHPTAAGSVKLGPTLVPGGGGLGLSGAL